LESGEIPTGYIAPHQAGYCALIAGLVGRAAAKLEHVPKIFYTPHAYAFDAPEFSAKKRAVFGLAERVMSRWATTRTFNVSDGEYRSALRHHIDKPSKFAVIYNGVGAADVFLDGQAASPRLLRYCTGLIQSSDFLILVSL
jgi:hypothetical protein